MCMHMRMVCMYSSQLIQLYVVSKSYILKTCTSTCNHACIIYTTTLPMEFIPVMTNVYSCTNYDPEYMCMNT